MNNNIHKNKEVDQETKDIKISGNNGREWEWMEGYRLITIMVALAMRILMTSFK